jgi:hypothetical protein
VKAITLHQPWASLIACGVKRVETRSKPTTHRGLVAIHAAVRWTPAQREFVAGIRFAYPGTALPAEPPLGAVVAVARVADCQVMTPELIAAQEERELEVGDWRPGRYAWLLEDVRPLRTPVPATGAQGWFFLPLAVREAVLAAGGAA